MQEAPPITTRTTDVAQALRLEILAGNRLPGERVQLEGLRQDYGVSLSPIREGLSRLVAEGLLIPSGQRGYRVAPVSIEEFLDIKAQRIHSEQRALCESIRLGGEDWEIALMTAFQRLKNFEAKRWQADEITAWEERHHIFHRTLISACGSPILMRFCELLHGMSDRYRRVLMKTSEPDRNVTQEHQALFDAALARDAGLANEVLGAHIERTGATVLRMMRERANN
ncbi:GntR family transcriptional regulator [Ottowia thiooxydans]|uniref:GntR family transcriptional regulator n=1 Tax=Ottowia thiooxydans TaxID=219182 RepID=UPI00041222E4|nr:FCD domain-containing protein [Ottowia thiooxydans]